MLRKLQKHDPDLARRHVVRLLDTFVHEESFYCIVMEPLAMSLRNLLQEGSSGGLFMADIRLAAFQLTSCLAFFQSLNMAHGDLKCTNVMLRRSEFSLQPHPRLGDPDEVAARPLWPFEEGHHPQLYPMWVVAMEDLLQMHGVPPSHQELKDAGLLVECTPSFHSVFVSHQWLGKHHPDEKGSQFSVLQKAFENIINGHIEVEL
ncbi:Prpf4b, partial [Symbiodinium necroappetens]